MSLRTDAPARLPRSWSNTVLIIAAAGVLMLVAAAPASAHTCASNTHDGCNGHSCPEGEAHDHSTLHDGAPAHWCQSQTCSADAVAKPPERNLSSEQLPSSCLVGGISSSAFPTMLGLPLAGVMGRRNGII